MRDFQVDHPIVETLSDWPGKSAPERGEHPAVWHMLDVVAVARILIEKGPLRFLTEAQKQALLVLVALHDCGKISITFRRQIREAFSPPEDAKHWRLSALIMGKEDALMEAALGGERDVRRILCMASAGHHGGPPTPVPAQMGRRLLRQHVGDEALQQFPVLLDALKVLFPAASLDGIDEALARRVSWLLSGLTNNADWIGSNTDWFEAQSPMPLDAYWNHACQTAAKAVPGVGLLSSHPTHPDEVSLMDQDLRPMQEAVSGVRLPEGPTLTILEDSTGSGKTESALILAQRMMAAGKASGIYFALPTMATSNAIFTRVGPIMSKLFHGDPSLVLMHGRRDLHEGFRSIVGVKSDDPAKASCADWIADDRRKALLAEVGVGTIDQALLAALPTRFHSLRQYALASRILIVDEAHSYDPYMEAELAQLLYFHAMFGGSAIVMTATLPQRMRDRFSRAFAAGLNSEVPPPTSWNYPLLVMQGGDELSETAVQPVPKPVVQVRRLDRAEQAVDRIVEAAEQGAACLWVRNAVDDAIAAVEALRARGIEAELLHARYAACDRADAEARLEGYFGSKGEDWSGRVLVATQVVEASLDVDFDLMVTDLAPIGAIIQRAGRLWRHMFKRPQNQRPIPEPYLYVLSPDPDHVQDDRWLHGVLDKGAWVYPQDIQWRTARILFDEGCLSGPDQLRTLIETVHGELAGELPEALRAVAAQTQGDAAAEGGLARANLLNPAFDYAANEQLHDDQIFPTRLGEEQQVLVLYREEDGRVVPWASEGPHWKRPALSEVQMNRARFNGTGLREMRMDPRLEEIQDGWHDWQRAQLFPVLVQEDGEIGAGLAYTLEKGLHWL